MRRKHANLTDHEIDAYLGEFFGGFLPTLELAEDLVARKAHAQEVLVLLCSRLDALACSATREDSPRKEAFTHFVRAYGCQRHVLECVSAGDLYYDLILHESMLPILIERAGRIRRYSADNDAVIELLVDSGIPLTRPDAQALLRRMIKALQARFRILPGQSRRKPVKGSREQVQQAVMKAFEGPRTSTFAPDLAKAMLSVLRANTLAEILYTSYRCQAIHSGLVSIREARFFAEHRPYWVSDESEFFGRYFSVEFPARFLMNLLRDCITTYRQHLLTKRAIPANVFWNAFGEDAWDHFELLDENTISEPRVLRPRAS